MHENTDPSRAQRIELILQQVDALPTLSPIALRLLRLSADQDADINEIVALVQADPALTGRLLAMCRSASTGLGDSITTVDRAVVMLGFEAVRSALLSVHLHALMANLGGESLDNDADNSTSGSTKTIDRSGLWRHVLAVACAAEALVNASRNNFPEVTPDEAFVCGLLHDLGKHALDAILPRTYQRVARLAENRRTDTAIIEREIIGVDHHTAGKRLAEHWGLPHVIQDVIWLHGQPLASLPDLPHRRVIALVTLADLLVRELHIGWSGNFAPLTNLSAIADELAIPADSLDAVRAALIELVTERTNALGLDEVDDTEVALDSVLAANRQLGQLNAALHERSRQSAQHTRSLQAIQSFLQRATAAGSLGRVMECAIQSAADRLKVSSCAIAYQARDAQPWRFCIRTTSGAPKHHVIDLTDIRANLPDLVEGHHVAQQASSTLSAASERIEGSLPIAVVAPLLAGDSRPALLLLPAGSESHLESPGLLALRAAWAAAIAAAAQHDGARRLGEQLADANRRLLEAQHELAEQQAHARLGQLAAGAAHEMNNPLAIISGRSQLLATQLVDENHKLSARAIVGACDQLAELISSLHFFADPPAPSFEAVDIPDLLSRIVRDLRLSFDQTEILSTHSVKLRIQGPIPPVWIDREQMAQAIHELLKNAFEASPEGFIELRAHIEDSDDRLHITVKDNGCGMSHHALTHAFDPFFSEKQAGRQTGLGLARARRIIDMHKGRIDLSSEPQQGTTARIILEQWQRNTADEKLAA